MCGHKLVATSKAVATIPVPRQQNGVFTTTRCGRSFFHIKRMWPESSFHHKKMWVNTSLPSEGYGQGLHSTLK